MRKGKFPDVNLSPQVLVDCVTVCFYMYTHICECMHTCGVCMCICVCMRVCACVHSFLCTCMRRLMTHMDVKEVIPQQRTPGYWPTV